MGKRKQLRTLFSSQSDLFPTRILLTPSLACCSMFECHVRMSVISVGEGGKNGARTKNARVKRQSERYFYETCSTIVGPKFEEILSASDEL